MGQQKKIRESPIKDYKYKLDEKNEKTKKRDFFFCLSSYLTIGLRISAPLIPLFLWEK